MTYSTGGPIQAADYNGFVDAVNAIYADTNAGATSLVPASSGYGVVPNLPHVAIGDAVTAADWTAMFDRIHKCGTHQGTSVTPIPPAVSPGGLVVAYNDYLSGPTLSDVITDLTANRLNIDLSQITLDNTPPAQVSAITWTTGLQLTWQIDFGSWNNARYFFNTGGKVRFAGTLPGSFPSGSASKYWQDMLSDMGTVQFAWNSTIPSSGSGTSLGFYNLTTSYIEVYKKSTLIGLPAAYGNNYISVQAKLNAAAGTNGKIDFIIQLIDNDSTLPLETKPTGFTFNIGYFVSSGAIPYPGTKTFNPGTFTVVPNGGGGGPILTVGVSPTSLAQSIAGAGTATTSTVTATATGGTAPYTYAWSNSSGTVTFSAPTSAATTFSKVLANGESASGNAIVTVTDNVLSTAFAPVPWAMNSNPSGSNKVGSITVNNGGQYSSPSVSLSITGGGGTGATATASMTPVSVSGSVTSISINSQSGYYSLNSATPTVSFSGGGGSGAAASCTLSSGKFLHANLRGIIVSSPFPTVTVSGGGGTGASILFDTTLGAWKLKAMASSGTIGNGGSGYTIPPTVSFTNNNPSKISVITWPEAYAVISGGQVVDIDFTNLGQIVGLDIDHPPGSLGTDFLLQMSISGGDGTGAWILPQVHMEPDGEWVYFSGPFVSGATAVYAQNQGSGYTSNVSLSVANTISGSPSEITMGKDIASVNLVNGGSGYTSAPSVSITGGTSAGPLDTPLSSLTAFGSWENYYTIGSVNVTNAGTGYTSSPAVNVSTGGFVHVAASLTANLIPE